MFLNPRMVEFPEHLSLNMESISAFNIPSDYKLMSVIEHMGSVRGGHYIAAKRICRPIKEEDEGMWLFTSDDKV